jgi:hypothetical protein
MKRLYLSLFAITTLTTQAQNLVINELMQSNIDCIMDDLNDFPDSWVELYNPTNASIDLQDYKIGTKKKADKAWQLPRKRIGPKGHVIIYCDKAGGDEGVSALHTNFRLESGKDGSLYLFKGDDIVDQQEKMAKQPAPNIAYGRQTDGADDWGYQATPTPGKANCGTTYKKVLDAPVFSHQGQVFENGQKIRLKISLPEGAPEGTVIRYTTDGSEPTATSAVFSPFFIAETKIVRAKLFCNGYLSPRSTCHSYIFFPTNRKLTLSVVSIMTNDKYLNDSKIGIFVDGNYNSSKKNYEYDWRRPINIELFETSGQKSVFNQLGEMRVCGGATRSAMRKSMAIYANKRFGEKRFNYEFFPDQKPGLKDFKSFMMRNAGNDFDYLYMRDAIIQRTMAGHVDLDWQAWRPVIVYINGEYRGLLNIRERSNEDNIYTNYDGLEDIDMIENDWELKEGTMDHYKAFKSFYNEHGHTLAEYAEWMDWQEYINLMVENLYYNNQDFPGNNIVIWRPLTDGSKWRWITKDTDFGLGLYGSQPDYNTIQWLYDNNYDSDRNWGNTYEATRLFRRLMEDADFKREFLDRAAIYMGDFLNEKGTRAVWDEMYDMIKTEYPYHRELVNRWWPNYDEELNNARTWLNKRTDYFYKQLADYYSWGTPTGLTINKEDNSDVELTFNGVKVSNQVFDGKYYAGRTINLSGKANTEGKTVTGWKVKVTGTTSKEVQGSELTLTMPKGAVAINPIIGNASGINDIINTQHLTPNTQIYDLMGNKVKTPQTGRIYIQNGKKITWR